MSKTAPNASTPQASPYVIAALYKFAPLEDIATHQESLRQVCQAAGISGTLILGFEGINGTIAGTRDGINTAIAAIRQLPGCAELEYKQSYAHKNPFLRLKVRVKKEIVTMGVPGVSPIAQVGEYVAPEDWNALISDPEVVLIDTRNDYEVEVGTFQGAINPHITTFRDFPQWFDDQAAALKGKKIATYCTGGIRCEKATSWLKAQGVDAVYHLKGGILKYLEDIPESESLWRGECFVFDRRVTVGHGLVPGRYDMCHACRRPIDEDDKTSPDYVPGVSCPRCVGTHSQAKTRGFRERQKQIALAKARGGQHLGTCTRIWNDTQI